MVVFNLAEELEKERKKNKELEIEIKQLRNARYSLDRVELEDRIDKAIEYIEKNYPVCAGEDLLNILKGSDNNE